MSQTERDKGAVRELRVELANDPEKFSDWEHRFVDSLMEQSERLGGRYPFELTPKQRIVVERIFDKARKE